MRKLILFDIDGTLVLTGGAGIRAMNRACEELVGNPDGLEGIPVAGRTDRIILADVVTRAGHTLDDGLLDQLRERYVANLREEIERPGRAQSFESLGARGGVKAVMPGIRELLDILHQRDDVFLALLTGNFAASARIKLEHFDLWRYFRCGAYADDAADRNAGYRSSRPSTSSWSVTRRTTWRAHMPSALPRSAWRRAASRAISCARAAPRSCSRIWPTRASS
jgi:phosphoglycolate phosphatase-like HAD superfamily hydrolase